MQYLYFLQNYFLQNYTLLFYNYFKYNVNLKKIIKDIFNRRAILCDHEPRINMDKESK